MPCGGLPGEVEQAVTNCFWLKATPDMKCAFGALGPKLEPPFFPTVQVKEGHLKAVDTRHLLRTGATSGLIQLPCDGDLFLAEHVFDLGLAQTVSIVFK